jgi:hypothetical protein
MAMGHCEDAPLGSGRIAADEITAADAALPPTEAAMSTQRSRFCPYCLTALIGVACLLGMPDLAGARTPIGYAGLWLFWLPVACALLRKGMLLAARG